MGKIPDYMVEDTFLTASPLSIFTPRCKQRMNQKGHCSRPAMQKREHNNQTDKMKTGRNAVSNFSEVKEEELLEFAGGGIPMPRWAKKIVPYAIGVYLIENWPDFKKGWSEGWNI
jgi:hypothetical protein